MKKIEAIIRTMKFEDVKHALETAGFDSMTVTEVKGRGRQKGITQQWRGAEYVVDMIPKTKIEIVAADVDAEKIIDIIATSAATGQIGDGKIFVTTIDDVIRVRTKERGDTAI
ncbi:transcriptional regulator [Methanoculleus taiwanensis]|uniref:Transcriptional regulator n=1 Tax=Methanoculleus taiwanensis TaxID=1550565 RepID=A0A498H4K2_9EURY|nr:P-II family nitrogen regulator [Methanoculleus taiwanensis]RXE56978.1 transcriptional regulator [Methanoculleus taiwanensis]